VTKYTKKVNKEKMGFNLKKQASKFVAFFAMNFFEEHFVAQENLNLFLYS
jgi:hypothetical protein